MSAGYSYAFRKSRPADLLRAGHECEWCGVGDQPFGLYSNLERAHLDGDKRNDAPENIAVVCRICHRRHDYEKWARARAAWLKDRHDKHVEALDAGRPILQFLCSVEDAE